MLPWIKFRTKLIVNSKTKSIIWIHKTSFFLFFFMNSVLWNRDGNISCIFSIGKVILFRIEKRLIFWIVKESAVWVWFRRLRTSDYPCCVFGTAFRLDYKTENKKYCVDSDTAETGLKITQQKWIPKRHHFWTRATTLEYSSKKEKGESYRFVVASA